MTLAAHIVTLAELTLQDPRRATRALLASGVPLPARTLGLLFVAVVSALLMSIQIGSEADPVDPMVAMLTASPFRAAVLQWLALALSALMIHGIGRACGGKGSLPDAILITLVKPQFQLGPERLGKGGVVKDETATADALAMIVQWLETQGWKVTASADSPILGGDGNKEALLCARRV